MGSLSDVRSALRMYDGLTKDDKSLLEYKLSLLERRERTLLKLLQEDSGIPDEGYNFTNFYVKFERRDWEVLLFRVSVPKTRNTSTSNRYQRGHSSYRTYQVTRLQDAEKRLQETFNKR